MSRPTAVVSFHLNPYTCGVARFNVALAGALGVPVDGFESLTSSTGHPLLSIKTSEVDPAGLASLHRLAESGRPFDVLLHGWTATPLEETLVRRASRAFGASVEIATGIRSVRGDVVAAFAPGAPVVDAQPAADVRLMTFGMAHKIDAARYATLGRLIRNDGRSFRLEVSTAIHEGSAFDESMFAVSGDVAAAFGGDVAFLGFLADGEISRRLRQCDALVAFFPSGVRENNTTVMSAMAHGCPVITNVDDRSPTFMRHDETIFDVQRLVQFPSAEELLRVGAAARAAVAPMDFAALARLLRVEAK